MHILNSEKIYISGNQITKGNVGHHCVCSENNLDNTKNNIGIYLHKTHGVNITNFNNISIYGPSNATGINSIGIQFADINVDNSDLKNYYMNNLINGSTGCFRFWEESMKKHIPNREMGVF